MTSSTMPQNAALELFKSVVDQAPDAVIFIDRDGAIRIWNHRAEAVFGYSAAEVLGTSVDVIIPERLRSAHGEGFRRAIETGLLRHADRVMTTRSVAKSGKKLYLDLSFSLVRDNTGAITGALAIARDCTERELARRAHDEHASNPGQSGT